MLSHSTSLSVVAVAAMLAVGDAGLAFGVLAVALAGLARRRGARCGSAPEASAAALGEPDESLRVLIDVSPLAIVALDPDLTVRVWNPSAERLFGWTRAEMLGRPYPLVPTGRDDEFRARLARVLSGEAFTGFETRRRRKDGTELDVSISVAPMRGRAGRVTGIVAFLDDIGDRKWADAERARLLVREQLRRREAEAIASIGRELVQSSDPDVVAQRIADTVRVLLNGEVAVLFGLEAVSGRLSSVAVSGGGRPALGPGLVIPRTAGLVGLAIHERRPVESPDVLTDGRVSLPHDLRERVKQAGHHAACAVPLVLKGEVVGALGVGDRAARTFGPEAIELLEAFADQATLALDNARRFRREQAARVEAETQSRAKDEFLAMLGHELRNPLGAIINAVTVLEQVSGVDEQAEQPRAIIARQAQHLTRLVNDLLDVSRVSSGKIQLDRSPVDLLQVAERCLGAFQQAGRTAQHAISVDGRPAWLDGDPVRLEQVIANLLDNAVKYTPPGGSIRVTVEPDGDTAVCRVADEGVGIAPELLPRVFDLFTQGHQTIDRAEGGLGLGLALVQRLVRLHGGQVGVTSEGPGRGSTFEVRLPGRRVPPPVAVPPAPTVAVGRRRVVLVEDNEDMREGLRVLLELDGHEVETAADGVRGLELILSVRPDVAFVDVGLPGLDGYAVARGVRAAPGGGSAIHLVALTGYGRSEDRQRALEAGFHAHLVKPVQHEDLARVLSARTAA
jgi:PAS domain S-box-containing protein